MDELLTRSSLPIDRSWRKGQVSRIRPEYQYTDSGIQLVASDAELTELSLQTAQVTEFLRNNGAEIASLATTPGVDSADLDFGVALLEGSVTVVFEASRELVRLAASAGLGINVSTFLTCNDDETEA